MFFSFPSRVVRGDSVKAFYNQCDLRTARIKTKVVWFYQSGTECNNVALLSKEEQWQGPPQNFENLYVHPSNRWSSHQNFHVWSFLMAIFHANGVWFLKGICPVLLSSLAACTEACTCTAVAEHIGITEVGRCESPMNKLNTCVPRSFPLELASYSGIPWFPIVFFTIYPLLN